jgi:outer membrane protein assembly factor BamA
MRGWAQVLLAALSLLAARAGSAQTPAAGAAAARADAWTGRPVAAVRFQAPRGVETEELRYLVEQRPGDPYDPQKVARSLSLLFRLGQFDDVQARVREGVDGLELTFVLVPSPRIGRVLLQGVGRLSRERVRAALSRAPGDPYTPQDEQRLATEVQRYYQSEGFLDARVEAGIRRGPRGGRVVLLHVSEGSRYRVGALRLPLPPAAGFPERWVRARLGRKLRSGAVYREDALRGGVQRLLDAYRKEGFVEVRLLAGPDARGGDARIPVPVEVDRERHSVAVSLALDAGRYVQPRFVLDGQERKRFRGVPLRDVVNLAGAQLASQSYVEDAARQLERWLQRRGRYHARVWPSIVEEPWRADPRAPDWEQPAVGRTRVLRFEVEMGPEVRLRRADIEVDGARAVREADVVQVLSDASPAVLGHRPPFWVALGLPFYRRLYTDAELQAALVVLRDYYRARGFLGISVEGAGRVELASDGGPGIRARLRVVVKEGVQTLVESLEVELGAGVARGLTETWRRRVEGKPFNPTALEQLRLDAERALAEEGHIDAKVAASSEIASDGSVARLRLSAVPGPGARFGQVVVRENRHTHVGLIAREVEVEVHPGQVFRPSALAEAQGRLLRSGLFEGVVVQPAQASGRVRDVEVLVNERKRFSFTLGTGLTWPDDGPRVSGELRLRNLDGRGLSLLARGRAGIDWRYLGPGLVPLPEYRASLGVELPYIPAVPLRLALTGVLNEELDERTYRLSRSSVVLSLGWHASERVTVDTRLEAQLRAPLRVDPVARLSDPADQPIEWPPRLTEAYPLVIGGISLTVDGRNERFNPDRGVYATASLDSTPAAMGPRIPGFGRLLGRALGLIPFGPEGMGLQIEAGGGLAWSYDGGLPPIEWRFTLGGTSTVRGYALDSIGPSGRRPGELEQFGLLVGDELNERTVPVGGNAFYRYSVQLQLPITFLENWRFVVFHDAGNALMYGKSPPGIDNSRKPVLHPSLGFGLRRITPIGPLRVDLAFRFLNFAKIPAVRPGEVVLLHFAVGAL